AGAPAGACQKPGDRFERDEQFKAPGWWTTMPHAEMGEQSEFDGITPRLSLTPGGNRTASPLIGEHTFEVMRDLLGLSDEDIAEHEAMGVFM
ncbi:MAG TPA: CoA transferase, partial [Tepidiformaceae bacterium]|nr:CoA transferase [Tepidiformaceae bacterium]